MCPSWRATPTLGRLFYNFYSYVKPFGYNGQFKILKFDSGHPSWSGNAENTFTRKADPNLGNPYFITYSYFEPFGCNGQSKFLKFDSGHPSWSGNPENTFTRKADPKLGYPYFITFRIWNRLAVMANGSFWNSILATLVGLATLKYVHSKGRSQLRGGLFYDIYSYLEPFGHNCVSTAQG